MFDARLAYDAIIKDGGITIALDGSEPTDGYAVGAYPSRTYILPLLTFRPQVLSHWVHVNLEWLSRENHFVGAWISEDRIYLDIVKVTDYSTAVGIASDKHQQCIFNLSSGLTIPTPDYVSATVGQGRFLHLVRKGQRTTLCGRQSTKRLATQTVLCLVCGTKRTREISPEYSS